VIGGIPTETVIAMWLLAALIALAMVLGED